MNLKHKKQLISIYKKGERQTEIFIVQL